MLLQFFEGRNIDRFDAKLAPFYNYSWPKMLSAPSNEVHPSILSPVKIVEFKIYSIHGCLGIPYLIKCTLSECGGGILCGCIGGIPGAGGRGGGGSPGGNG